MSDTICPICGSEAEIYPTQYDGKDIRCTQCGEYFVSRSVLPYFKYTDVQPRLPKLSSWISEQNKIFGIQQPRILSDTADKAVAQKDKTIKEKFDCFMRTLQDLPKAPLEPKNFNHCYIYTDYELSQIYKKAVEKNYVNGKFPRMYEGLAFDGLEYIESLSEINKNSKNIFVAFHFNDETQAIFDNDIKNAIEELGFNYVRVSSSTTPTDTHINDDIIGKIKSSKIVIADFSGQRNSVYFEAGFAMGLRIPVIWSCKNDEVDKLSFDTRQYPHILWDTKEELVERLTQRIKTLL
jgi:nucleoside 2-deoxyribosyltransferase